jgi:FlaA1/EpsC-like NDP-sugar epimerase
MLSSLTKIPRGLKQSLLIVFDSVVIIFCLVASFYIRLGYIYPLIKDTDLLITIIGAPFLWLVISNYFQVYNGLIRYVGSNSLWHIFQSATSYSILWGLIIFMAGIDSVPRSVIIINWVLVIIIVSGSRFFAKWLLSEKNDGEKNVLIYGAGSAGRQLANALKESLEFKSVAFIDDAADIHKHYISGLKVYSRIDLEDLIKKFNISAVLLALPSVSRSKRKEIVDYLEPYPVKVCSLPGVSELAEGKFHINEILEINLNDLLGREELKLDTDLLKFNIFEKVVLVTGAGGSIGSEICRQIIKLKPKAIILYEISESSLYTIERELIIISASDVEIFPVLGSVVDKKRIESIYKYYGVNTVYHAAAYKHVPLVESNKAQGIINNTIGTLVAAEAAITAKVDTFILISTDKAVRPSNIMGVSKRLAELILQAFDKLPHSTCFTMVRFGNVLDSSGSVIPLFRDQIKNGGPITVTHEDIVRYFMTIPEAVRLVIQAGSIAKGGEVFVLDMGEPILINDLAKKMIRLSGLEVLDENHPDGDIEITYSGLRPGEKMYEELFLEGEYTYTKNKLIMRAEEQMINWEELGPLILEIKKAALTSNIQGIYKILLQLVPEFDSRINK